MPTRNVDLTPEQDAFVEEVVRAVKLELLRAQVKAGLDALDRGAFTEIEDTDLDASPFR